MKKVILLVITALVIAAVIFFGVKAIKATPNTVDTGKPVTTVKATVVATAVVTAKPTQPPVVTTTSSTTSVTTATATPAPVATTTPDTAIPVTDEAHAYFEKVYQEGLRAEMVPAMVRKEWGGFLKSVKLGDPIITTWTALDLPLGDDPEWAIPTRSGKPIVAGWAYMTRRVATVLDVVPDWYCFEHAAAKLSCDTQAEDYTLYKSVTAARALRAFRLVRSEDGGFEWRIALCECGVTENLEDEPSESSPTKKPTTPTTTPKPTKKPTAPTTTPKPTTKPTQKPTDPAHEAAPTLPPKTEAEHEAAPTLPPKGNDNEAPPSMGGDTW